MAGPHVFIGTSDGDFDNTMNWDTGVVPATGEVWAMNHQTLRAITAGLNQSTKTFLRVDISQGCRFGIASSAAPLQCGITDLHYAGTGPEAWFQGTITRTYAEYSSKDPNALVLDGVLTDLIIGDAVVRLTGTRTWASGGRIHVGNATGRSDNVPSLTIPGTYTLTTNNPEIQVTGGMVSCYADLPTRIALAGGEFRLEHDDTYDPTGALIEATGNALFLWRSAGTITRYEGSGSSQFINAYNLDKTLTDASMYDAAQMDFRAGHLVTFTNGIRSYGFNRPMFAAGDLIGAT